jgi:hypothetical protein
MGAAVIRDHLRGTRRWERNFAGTAGIFDDDFRTGAEHIHSFFRDVRSFLDGMERYILRASPAGPVHAYEAVTELTEESACRLVAQVHDFFARVRAVRRREPWRDSSRFRVGPRLETRSRTQ